MSRICLSRYFWIFIIIGFGGCLDETTLISSSATEQAAQSTFTVLDTATATEITTTVPESTQVTTDSTSVKSDISTEGTPTSAGNSTEPPTSTEPSQHVTTSNIDSTTLTLPVSSNEWTSSVAISSVFPIDQSTTVIADSNTTTLSPTSLSASTNEPTNLAESTYIPTDSNTIPASTNERTTPLATSSNTPVVSTSLPSVSTSELPTSSFTSIRPTSSFPATTAGSNSPLETSPTAVATTSKAKTITVTVTDSITISQFPTSLPTSISSSSEKTSYPSTLPITTTVAASSTLPGSTNKQVETNSTTAAITSNGGQPTAIADSTTTPPELPTSKLASSTANEVPTSTVQQPTTSMTPPLPPMNITTVIESTTYQPPISTTPPTQTIHGEMETQYVQVNGSRYYWLEELRYTNSPSFKSFASVFETQLKGIFEEAVRYCSWVTVGSFRPGSRIRVERAFYWRAVDNNNNYTIIASYSANINGSVTRETVDRKIKEVIATRLNGTLSELFGKVEIFIEKKKDTWPDVGTLIAIIVCSLVGVLLIILLGWYLVSALRKSGKDQHGKMESSHSSTSVPSNINNTDQSTIVPNLAYTTIASSSVKIAPSTSSGAQDNSVMWSYPQSFSPPVPMPRATFSRAANFRKSTSSQNDDVAYF